MVSYGWAMDRGGGRRGAREGGDGSDPEGRFVPLKAELHLLVDDPGLDAPALVGDANGRRAGNRQQRRHHDTSE